MKHTKKLNTFSFVIIIVVFLSIETHFTLENPPPKNNAFPVVTKNICRCSLQSRRHSELVKQEQTRTSAFRPTQNRQNTKLKHVAGTIVKATLRLSNVVITKYPLMFCRASVAQQCTTIVFESLPLRGQTQHKLHSKPCKVTT